MLTRYTPPRRRAALGDTPGASGAYAVWTATVKDELASLYGDAWRTHGAPTVMPSNVPPSMQQYAGQPAAMFDNATYGALFNAGKIDPFRPQVASNSGKVVYVLAPADVIADAPPTMTAMQSLANTVFTTGDIAASNLGIPSLQSIEDFLKGIGRDVLVGVAVTVAVAYFLKRRRA